jgi:hypothetical protein
VEAGAVVEAFARLVGVEAVAGGIVGGALHAGRALCREA